MSTESSDRTPLELAADNLEQAADLAELAWQEPGEQAQLGAVEQTLDHCHQALTHLHQSGDLDYPTRLRGYAAAAAALLRVRELVRDEPTRQALDGMTAACGALIGETLAWDYAQQRKGLDYLFMSQVLAALAAAEMDPQARLEMHRSELVAAATAARLLHPTSDLGTAQHARAVARQAQRQASGLSAAGSALPRCHRCGLENRPGDRYCTRCGAPLSTAQSLPETATQDLASHPPGRARRCPACAALNRPGNRFCTHCGALQG